MDLFRLTCYSVGFIGSVMAASVLFRVRYRLGWLLGAVMVVWAVVCASLAAMLITNMLTGDPRPGWADWVWLVDSLLLAAMPLALYAWMWRNGDA